MAEVENAAQSTVDAGELAKFSALAEQWWDPKGKFAVLHKFNPVRLAYIKSQVCARFGRDPLSLRPFSGLRLLDIGCGGGLLTEPMARLGADVVGVDPAERNIRTAGVHAAAQGLAIDYRVATAEDLAAKGEKFDVILNMEVIEHVAEPAHYIARCAEMLKPGGIMVLATLNRTFRSFALAIIGAEYVLGWLPRGTHHWEKFITPDELEALCRAAGLASCDLTGIVFNPLDGTWRRSEDSSVNYMMLVEKPAVAAAA
ncbi:bifunctional 2-polyprenyl-6-hydroxyphenol methylase/3-demethylubiquinol 3-O-methyltransferase UbiG [Rhodoligotrophos defluvii]|uniref:bifunctional 2-polyprenyl-6-hydroxyphenol methylase/3-demethylubiquinol 3-O-methyltransferase UbiG n=1 Tax=Rhodoligotrophos defluvii TaxID=2561934 RepID=UPI0010C9A826|nr:bifunctional 2-polyprenyl-6-hydroxyphenol methylase/3-demethylubiquinol 3-O-methyltransferase UbiG [Rhodoligotrophos defluvii]